MAINKKLIHFKNKTKFDEELAKNNINDSSICFIKDTQQIWTHGQLYSCNVDISTLSDVLRVDETGLIHRNQLGEDIIGLDTEATGEYSHAEGINTIASGIGSHAEGGTYKVGEDGTITYTNGGTASGNASHAEGRGTLAQGVGSHAEGYKTTAGENSAHAEGYETTASGVCSHAEGRGSVASGIVAHAEGRSTTASGEHSHAEGRNTIASGIVSHAEGGATTASKDCAHAEGGYTTASNTYAHAEGYETTASGQAAHTEGCKTQAKGNWTHAEGYGSIAESNGAHAEGGYWNLDGSLAVGGHARAAASHAEGVGTITSNIAEHASGKYNVSTKDETLFSVGNGTSDTDRHNAFEIKSDNTAYINNKRIVTEDTPHVITITYIELKTLRDNAHLVPGAMYRITDYVCTTVHPDAASANHPFDIVVTAISNNALSEEASVVLHEGDTYFANSNLSSWKVWYTLDNDSHRFNWADEENGKGVIYRMIDDKNNDLPYDFKNILFIEHVYIYEVNELGNSISLDNPLEISYTLLADTDEEYNGKDDVIVEINQSDETPDKAGQDVWVLYKTDLGGYQEEGVDYADMFVFVDKYDYNGQTWDRWRKAEFDGDAWHWVTHEGSSVCILTEQLLDVTGNNPIYRYTFNLEEFLGDVSQADASMVAKDSESERGVRNNYMQSCYIDYNGIGTSEHVLPINVFKITSTEWFNIYGNHFSGLYTYNTFKGEQFTANRFEPACCENTFTDLTMGTFGSYFCGNTLGYSNIISCGSYNMANTLEGSILTLGNYVIDCDVNGWSLTVAANTGGCDISGNNAIINSINGFDERKIIEIPDSEYTLKVAQNSLGEIKIYNEADLIA
jgi:hypothetical protein